MLTVHIYLSISLLQICLVKKGCSVFQGRLYHGFSDCMLKVCQTEGVLGLYKGMGPVFLRLAPHTMLSMVFWDTMRQQALKNQHEAS